jgi:hypothetical protein
VLAPRRRHALLALAATLTLLALPVLHPSAWTHRGLELGGESTALAATAGGAGLEEHSSCPLCRALAQARGAIASPSFSVLAPSVATVPAPLPAASLPLPAAPAGLGARAPPTA